MIVMIKFYRQEKNKFTNWVEEKLEDMVLAHELIDVHEDRSLPDGITQEDLPALSDGHESWTSQNGIKEFLEKLHQDLKFSRSLTSDACYVDPDNPEECL